MWAIGDQRKWAGRSWGTKLFGYNFYIVPQRKFHSWSQLFIAILASWFLNHLWSNCSNCLVVFFMYPLFASIIFVTFPSADDLSNRKVGTSRMNTPSNKETCSVFGTAQIYWTVLPFIPKLYLVWKFSLFKIQQHSLQKKCVFSISSILKHVSNLECLQLLRDGLIWEFAPSAWKI